MKKVYKWGFPLPRTHTGMLLGNGLLGAMIWGGGATLNITLGRADHWDRRGGMTWTPDMSYENIKKYLAEDNEARLNEIFKEEGARPSVLPIGRFEICFAKTYRLVRGSLNLAKGVCKVTLRKARKETEVRIVMDMTTPVLSLQMSKDLRVKEIRPVTSWNYVGEELAARGFDEPELFNVKSFTGWCQQVPDGAALTVAALERKREIHMSAELDKSMEDTARRVFEQLSTTKFATVKQNAAAWWRDYWNRCIAVSIPNKRLQFLHDYGMYKFACMTAYSERYAVPATLQGPWIEEYQMPPWSSDYHFNINVQMCYWPAYHGNVTGHLLPLFNMIHSWTDQLRHNAKMFVGVDDGRLLPHAVSDECKFICGYWGHSVDHGSTAWVAQMMYRYFCYTRDPDFLREIAYPFMKGTMAVYEKMLEKNEDGFSLLLGVSPEYFATDHRGNRRGFGPDASFQLACIRRLAMDLIEAADVLKEGVEPIWYDYLARIPRATVEETDGREMIVLWKGQNLDESHRHHSHLGAIVPFDIFDPEREDDHWRTILNNTIDHWVNQGMGRWSGWCVPWAAMIHTRFNSGETAEMLLEAWERVFTNCGHGTLHDADISGFTLMRRRRVRDNYCKAPEKVGEHRNEIMQLDAGMGATAAIQEMLFHTRQDVHYIMAGIPKRWRDVSFKRVLSDHGMVFSAERKNGKLHNIVVKSPNGGLLKIANPWQTDVKMIVNNQKETTLRGHCVEIDTRAGDCILLMSYE